jgi:hypothetical protein
MSIADEIRALLELYESGVLTEDEFDLAKTALLRKYTKKPTTQLVIGWILLVIGSLGLLGFALEAAEGPAQRDQVETIGALIFVLVLMVLGALLIGLHYKQR